MSEKRKLQRRNFIYDIEVIDRTKEIDLDNEAHVMGDLADITVEGVMIVSDNPIEENREFDMRVMLPEKIADRDQIDFKASSIRCNKTIHDSIYTTGFKITELDESNRIIIDTLIKEYAV